MSNNNLTFISLFCLKNILFQVFVYFNGAFYFSFMIGMVISMFSYGNNVVELFDYGLGFALLFAFVYVGYFAVRGVQILEGISKERNLFEDKGIKLMMFLGSISFILFFVLYLLWPKIILHGHFGDFVSITQIFFNKALLFIIIISFELILFSRVIYKLFGYNPFCFLVKSFADATKSNFPKKNEFIYPLIFNFFIVLLIVLAYCTDSVINFIALKFHFSLFDSRVAYYLFGFSTLALHLSYIANYFKKYYLDRAINNNTKI